MLLNFADDEEQEAMKMSYVGKRLDRKEKGRFWKNYGYLITTVLVVLVLFRVILQLAWVPSGSMIPTLPERSLLLSMRLPYLVGDPEVERGDIVTFWDEEMGKLLVKRVVGLGGEEISFRNGYTYINGEKLSEPYLPRQGETQSNRQTSYQIPEGCIFVMGDNRTGSYDSRSLLQPYIPLEAIRAKTMLIISPLGPLPGDEETHWRGIRLAG